MKPFARSGAGGATLWILVVASTALWTLGLATSHTLGGLIHVLLLFAIALVLIRLIPGPRAVD